MKSYWSLCRLSGKKSGCPPWTSGRAIAGITQNYGRRYPVNRQTSKLLNILLNSPGQYFHYEELAARFQVSTRSIRNYTQSILDFLEDLHMPSALTVSEGGIAFTGGAEGSSLLLQAAY